MESTVCCFRAAGELGRGPEALLHRRLVQEIVLPLGGQAEPGAASALR